MIKACVIGYPIKHSRSPLIHNHWLKLHGIAGQYEQREVEPTELSSFLRSLPQSEYVGCNITLPHKEAAYDLVSHPDQRAERMKSINTVYIRNNQTCATSTDGEGFVENIRWRAPSFNFQGATILILGAGGSARAIIDEMLQRGAAKIILANRTLAKAEAIAHSIEGSIEVAALNNVADYIGLADLVVNTTSAGIADTAKLEIPFDKIQSKALVTDINYVPLVTPFLKEAEARGLQTVTGLGMLLHQAVTGFELWFGVRPTVTQELYDLVAQNIDPEYQP